MLVLYILIITYSIQPLQKQSKIPENPSLSTSDMTISWYLALYYKYRDYPITHINSRYKKNQLKAIYTNIFYRLALYFYIDVQTQLKGKQHQGDIDAIMSQTGDEDGKPARSSKGSYRFYSGSIHSKMDLRRISNQQLKSQNFQNGDLAYQMTQKSLASMSIFKKTDKFLNQQTQKQLQLTNTIFLNYIISTSKQLISSIILQSPKQSNGNNSFISQNSSMANEMQVEIQIQTETEREREIGTRTEQNPNIQQASKDGNRMRIEIETIPMNNQEINYYFIQFCSKIEVQDTKGHKHNGEDKTHRNHKKNNDTEAVKGKKHSRWDDGSLKQFVMEEEKLEDRSFGDSFCSRGTQKSFKEVIDKSKKGEELDQILLQILEDKLQFAHRFLSKFQYASNSNKNEMKQIFAGSLNILVQTWLQIVTIIQKQDIINEIVKQFVRNSGNPFIEKINSYLYFITMVNTKYLFSKTISKQNFLWLIPEFLSGNRSLSDLKLQKSQNLITIYDKILDRYVHSSEAYQKAFENWTHVGRIVSQLFIQNQNIFWPKILQSCCDLMDRYLQQKIQFSYSLILLHQNLSTSQNSMFEFERIHYLKCLQSLLEHQIGFNNSCLSSTNFQQKTNSHIKIPSSPCSSSSPFCQSLQSTPFSFYDESTHKENKIIELRQWQQKIQEGIERLKGYRKLLDVGMEIFHGDLQCVTAFFVESSKNFGKIGAIGQIGFYGIVERYCYKLKNSGIYANFLQKCKNDFDVESFLLEIEVHKQHHKQIAKKITNNFRCKQMSSKNSPACLSVAPQQKPLDSDKNDQQSNYSQYQTNPQHNNPQILHILQQQTMLDIISRLKQKSSHYSHSRQLKILAQLNTHLRLLNQCNFILTIVQQSQHVKILPKIGEMGKQDKGNEKEKYGAKGKNFIVLNSRQLVESLSKISVELGQNKGLMMHTTHYRKTSNQNKIARISSINMSEKKNIEYLQGNYQNQNMASPKNGYPQHFSFVKGNFEENFNLDYGKIISCIRMHNRCLDLLVTIYYHYCKYYQILNRNMICQACLGQSGQVKKDKSNNIDAATVPILGLVPKQSSIPNKKLLILLLKYQSTPAQKLPEFLVILQQQLHLNSLAHEILLCHIFIASLQVDCETFLAIYGQDLISEDKLERVKVIGKGYYEAVHQLRNREKGCGNGGEDGIEGSRGDLGFQGVKNLYLENLLVIVISLVELVSERVEDSKELAPFTTLLMNYFTSKTCQASSKQTMKSIQQLINFTKIISQAFDWNQQNLPILSQKDLLFKLLELRTTLSNPHIVSSLKNLIYKQLSILTKYDNSTRKVEYLQKKLMYLMLREIYFESYYDIGIFQVKSVQAKKNFAMYESKMLNFFNEIISKDEQEFVQRKSEELKQRSAHLKGYLLDYQKQPLCPQQQRKFIIKTVCLFDKTLNLLTQNRQFQMKKRSSNSGTLSRKKPPTSQPIYIHYLSSQFLKPSTQSRVKVFQTESYFFFKAIQIYEGMLCKKVEQNQKKYSVYRDLGNQYQMPMAVCVSFSERDLEIVKESRDSLLALWLNYQYREYHEWKMRISHENFLSKIQKLYIDLDVRHKVFESFKDKILNYQMQKTKIYHQYMDYIRGLKLDVYSHVTGEDPFPYFKLINAIKLYRLDIKKKQLEEKVNEQFGKNLGKWNEGIAKDMSDYHKWVTKQMMFWQQMNNGSNKTIKQLFQIYGIVSKQLKRQQCRTIQITLKSKQMNSMPMRPVSTTKSSKKFSNSISISNTNTNSLGSTNTLTNLRKSLHKQKQLLNK